MDRLLFELRLAIRRLRAQPFFTAIAVLSLAFGIGATTVFFGLLDSTLLKPLPVEKPGELFSVVDPRFGAPVISYPNYLDLSNRNTVFAGLMSYRIAPVNASLGPGRNFRMWGYLVSGNYFPVLGIAPVRGRLLTPDDDRIRNGHAVAVLSYQAWKQKFAGADDIAGKTLKLNGLAYTIVGVTPAEFQGTERFYAPELYVPVAMTAQLEPGARYLDDRDTQNQFVLGRLKPGVTRAQAETELMALTKRLGEEHPKENEGWKLKLVEPGWGGDFLRGGVIGFTGVLIAVACVLLLVVCVNLASLLLAQASERRKETAIRLAIGASRGQLIRQLLFESLVLSVLGGALGLLGTVWAVDLIRHFRPPVDFALELSIGIDERVVLFSVAVTFAACLLLGLAPAWQSTRTELSGALKNDASDPRRRRWPMRDVLVGVQIALSVVLLAVSGLMLRSLQNAMTVSLGFNPRNAAVVGFDVALQGYSSEKGARFQKDLVRRMREMPGIKEVGYGSGVPLDLGFSNTSVYESGQPEPAASRMPMAQVFDVSPGYLGALETRQLAGRDFSETDDAKARRVLIVNGTFARTILKLARPEEAVGKRVETGNRTHQIVGVVEDGKYIALPEAPKAVMFRPAYQHYNSTTRLVWRTAGGAEGSLGRVRQLLLEMDPEMTLYDPETLEQHLNLPLLPSRFAAGALSSFGVITMLLAAIGIYGVMAFAVARRTREIGIRMAIGASAWQIGKLILTRALWLVGLGSVAGTAIALAASAHLKPVLLGVNPRDPLIHLVGLAVMAGIALAASWLPTRRAMGLDPNRSLRRD